MLYALVEKKEHVKVPNASLCGEAFISTGTHSQPSAFFFPLSLSLLIFFILLNKKSLSFTSHFFSPLQLSNLFPMYYFFPTRIQWDVQRFLIPT